MRFRSTSMSLVAFCLGLLAVRSFGELVMIREKPVREGDPYKLTCVAEDHGATLVWNDDLRHPVQPKISDTVPVTSQITPNCAVAEKDNCRAYWKKMGDWAIVNSIDYPMAPVVDYRWKEFSEHSFPRNDLEYDYRYVGNVRPSGTVVFSARVLGDINVRLCKEEIPSSENSCFWITIPTWPNETLCFWEPTEDRKRYQKECVKATEYAKLSPQSANNISEWRTFILRWDKNHGEIISNDAGIISQKQFDVPINVNHLFVQSTDVGRIRFHSYDYLLTQTPGTLSSFEFHVGERNSCFKLLVHHCIGCKLEIRVVSDSSYTAVTDISENSDLAYGKLPIWTNLRLYINGGSDYNHWITFEIVATLNPSGIQGRWAIDRLRKCDSVDAARISGNVFPKLLTATSSSWPSIGCQQLSFGRTTVVSSKALTTRKNPIDPRICKHGQEGPACAFNCTDSCKGTSICDQSECICAPGFGGRDCTECSDGRHRFDSEETCGHCKFGMCNKITGFCDDCEDDYLSPYCKTRLPPGLKAPVLSDFTSTTASLKYQLDVEGVQKISFQLKTETEQWQIYPSFARKSGTTWICTAFIRCLSPGTPYSVQAVVTIQGTLVKSPETPFTTNDQLPILVRNLGVMSRGHGDVALTWNGPQIPEFWELKRFVVDIEPLNTTLRNDHRSESTDSIYYPVYPYKPNYGMILHLLTSSVYRLTVTALTSCRSRDRIKSHLSVNYRVPASPGFASEEKLEVDRTETFIILKLPSVINDTTSTRMIIVVRGWPNCTTSPMSEDSKKLANMTKSDKGWIAVIFEASDIRPAHWTIGKDSKRDSPENCPLHPEQTYVVMVVVVDLVDNVSAVITSLPIYPANPATIESGKSNLFWLVLLFILLICSFLIYIWRRKRNNIYGRLKFPSVKYFNEIPLPPNGTRGDWPFDCCPPPLKLKKFEDYVRRAAENGVLESQFQMLRRGLLRPCDRGMLAKNKPKNRYGNLIAYDDTRVILKGELYGPDSDYINANYIQGYNKENAYIATQSPMSSTVIDFWRMIWQEEVRVVCMLVNVIEDGQKICEQYWPEVEQEVDHGHFNIRNVEQRVYTHYTHRTFELTSSHEAGSRKVKHLHYTDWPEQGVPVYSHSIANYLNELRAMAPGPGPIVVHCTSGAGRTGTIILSDICLSYAAAEGTVDVFAEARKMYNARANMLDNLQQYALAHLMPTQCLLYLSTKISCRDVSPEKIKQLKKNLPVHIQRLEVSSWKDKALRPLEPIRPPLADHLAKNRFPKFAPGGPSLVKLKRYPTHDTNSDYISAVSVDGLKIKRQFLASQLPLPETLSDFWRLVAEKQVELIVVLQRPSPEDPSCSEIIPPEGTTIAPVPYITVKTKSTDDSNEYYTTDKLLLVDTSEPEARWQDITVLTCNNWSLAEDAEPPPPQALVALWSASENISRVKGYTLVLCHDGVTGCGLYLAMSLLLERMTVEHECDVILAVRAVRQSRSQFVNSTEQFLYLYDAAVKLVECFRIYENFN